MLIAALSRIAQRMKKTATSRNERYRYSAQLGAAIAYGCKNGQSIGSILMSVIRSGYAPTRIAPDFTNVVYLSTSERHVRGN